MLISQTDPYTPMLLLIFGVPSWLAILALIICLIMGWALIREILDQFKK